MLPLQIPGVPGGSEGVAVLFTLIIPLVVAWWTYRDAKRRNNENPLNWGISMFLFGFLGFFPIIVGIGLWRSVRKDV
ncbi:hypothetical protein [Halococcus hamelinensis]|uniref:Cardiolipin synthase N-terminal domain-containing protein n=1 Tax=Halococcus hamelinensis 100A6 TaxID=1132509 RepID=M0M573_9EURY|nr:hypothetical protein [Halococcus hamelinensis]EMA39789.1 hypothetical protein C447_06017 [Halococcus hamelinensis 100A6]